MFFFFNLDKISTLVFIFRYKP